MYVVAAIVMVEGSVMRPAVTGRLIPGVRAATFEITAGREPLPEIVERHLCVPQVDSGHCVAAIHAVEATVLDGRLG